MIQNLKRKGKIDMKKTKYIFSILLLITFFLTACFNNANNSNDSNVTNPATHVNKPQVSVAFLKGPTGIGAVELMDSTDTSNDYTFEVSSAPDEVMAKLINGGVDIAALPTNVAAAVYNKSEQEVSVAAINTLGVLHLLERGNSIQSISDLQEKTIYATGQGSTPEYVLNYILQKNNINATVEYMTEHAELAAAFLAGNIDIALLPEPNATAVLLKDNSIRRVLDLTEEWNKTQTTNSLKASQLAMGCIVARKEFIENNPDAFENFLKEYQSSVHYVNSNVTEAAALVEKYGIMDSATAAEKAIPNCNIVFISGEEMKQALTGFYNVLFQANPKSIGGVLPNEDFYYTK